MLSLETCLKGLGFKKLGFVKGMVQDKLLQYLTLNKTLLS